MYNRSLLLVLSFDAGSYPLIPRHGPGRKLPTQLPTRRGSPGGLPSLLPAWLPWLPRGGWGAAPAVPRLPELWRAPRGRPLQQGGLPRLPPKTWLPRTARGATHLRGHPPSHRRLPPLLTTLRAIPGKGRALRRLLCDFCHLFYGSSCSAPNASFASNSP